MRPKYIKESLIYPDLQWVIISFIGLKTFSMTSNNHCDGHEPRTPSSRQNLEENYKDIRLDGVYISSISLSLFS